MDETDLSVMFYKLIKKAIPELSNREDFDVEQVVIDHCHECGTAIQGWKYKFHDDEEWKTHDPQQGCSECEIKEFLVKSNNQHKQQVSHSLISRYWYIPIDLKEAGFKRYLRTNKVTTNAANLCIEYVREFKDFEPEKRANLVLMGNPGTGKSHLAAAIARTLKSEGFIVGFITTGRLLTMIKQTYQKGAEQNEHDILKDLSKFDLLVLDDLGAEITTKDEFNWAKTKIFEIINSRIGKPTIYTTNFDDETIDKIVGERVASRLYNNTRHIDMFTDDFRKNLRII